MSDLLASLNQFPFVTFKEQASSPATPPTDTIIMYRKTDGKLYVKDDSGTETEVGSGGGGGGGLVSPPSSGTSSGTAGQLAVAADYSAAYLCVATNTWREFPLNTVLAPETRTYVSDGDTNGIFYRIGQLAGAGTWVNPATAGWVSITNSGTTNGSNTQTVNRATEDFWVTPGAAATISFDFGTRRITPNKLSFRQRNNGKYDVSAVMDVQVSVDGIAWTTLNSAVNMPTGNSAWLTVTPATVTGRYKHLRLVQNIGSYFTLGEVEVYGTLWV